MNCMIKILLRWMNPKIVEGVMQKDGGMCIAECPFEKPQKPLTPGNTEIDFDECC